MVYKSAMLTIVFEFVWPVTMIFRAIRPFIAVMRTGFVGAVVTGVGAGAFR